MSHNIYVHTKKMPDEKATTVISNEKSKRTKGYFARTEALLKLARIETTDFDKSEADPNY
jgi:hypothetical protein